MSLPLQKIIVRPSTTIMQPISDLQMSLPTIIAWLISILAGGPSLFLALLDHPLCPSSLLRNTRKRASRIFPGYKLLQCAKVLHLFVEKRIPKLPKQLATANAIEDSSLPSQRHPLLHIPCLIILLLVGTLPGLHEPQSRVLNGYQLMATHTVLRIVLMSYMETKGVQMYGEHGRTFGPSS